MSHACVFLSVSGSIWEVVNESSISELAQQIGCPLLPAAAVSPTQNAPCKRAGGAWISIKWNDSSTKTVALCSLELVNEHSNRRQWAQSMGAWSIFASPFSALISCVTISISPTTTPVSCSHARPKHRDRSPAPGTIKCSVVLSCPVLQVPIMLRHRLVLQSEFRSCICVGNNKRKSQVNALVGSRDCHWARKSCKRVD